MGFFSFLFWAPGLYQFFISATALKFVSVLTGVYQSKTPPPAKVKFKYLLWTVENEPFCVSTGPVWNAARTVPRRS